jgi:hypothetical protein
MQDTALRTYTEEGTEGLQAEGDDDLQMTIALELFTEKGIGENPNSCGTPSGSRTARSLTRCRSLLKCRARREPRLAICRFCRGNCWPMSVSCCPLACRLLPQHAGQARGDALQRFPHPALNLVCFEGGYRELCSKGEMRKLLDRKVGVRNGKAVSVERNSLITTMSSQAT